MPENKPYGSWKSPITPQMIARGGTNFGYPVLEGDATYWIETRPAEGGRQTVVRSLGEGEIEELVPAPYNARTRVHEYGGRPYTVVDGVIYFANFQDQRLYVQEPGGEPRPLTPESALRYAEPQVDRARGRLICVVEDHSGEGEAANYIASLRLADGEDRVILAEGADFYASPALSPDGQRLAWLAWHHPNMPWDETELWLGELDPQGRVHSARKIAGEVGESIVEPLWSPKGELYFVAERSGWWNLYRWRDETPQALYPMEAEFSGPMWSLGWSSAAFDPAGNLVCIYNQNGATRLARLDPEAQTLEILDERYTYHAGLAAAGRRCVFIAGAPDAFISVVELDLDTGAKRVLRQSRELNVDLGYISSPEAVEFPTEDGLTAHAYFYPPRNKDYQAQEGEKPPLLVISHGGPTSATVSVLNYSIQFWTSRGIGVLDVNYGGSTGYGRAYRQRLNQRWGIVDVDDCVNGALYLVSQGRADRERLIIRGGSAGGYTTLCALAFRDVFKAGASYYGVGDVAALAADTHKFESRYMDSMIGPEPELWDLCRARSPIHHVQGLNCPVILLQGLEDKVVLPNQSEMMFEALKEKGLPVAYLPFEGEQHGFRKAETIQRALEAEYYFYARVFGFEPADEIEPVAIENL
jgi:dipeptidyl aminopeptidase/acylaminoacyl peptidase